MGNLSCMAVERHAMRPWSGLRGPGRVKLGVVPTSPGWGYWKGGFGVDIDTVFWLFLLGDVVASSGYRG